VKWDEIENTSRQIHRLALHLVGLVRRPNRANGKRTGRRRT
jgi:hypothetical protein